MRLALAALAVATAMPAMACDVRLRHTVRVCPAVIYTPQDCEDTYTGRPNDKITSPATVHLMKGGFAYYCPSHEACVPLEAISLNKCRLEYVPRQNGESPEYLGHIVVE